MFEDVMRLTSNAVRGCIVAPPGKKLVIADLANIEGRGAAWLAGEEWKLQAFREYDAGIGPDLYKATYAKAFGISADDVSKPKRQIGKVMELACGYQGSMGAFVTFAAVYGIDLDAMAELAFPQFSDEALRSADELLEWFYSKKIRVPPLPRRTLIVILCLVYGWRDAHQHIKATWKALEEAAILATLNPGELIDAGRFRLLRDGAWLRLLMPSGRVLVYPHPQVSDKGKLSYMGVDQFTRQWKRIFTYGGKLFENATQSFSRDILYDAHQRIEAAGYELVLHVHDENITEVPDEDRYSHEELSYLMTRPPCIADGMPSYCPDLPLAAAGFTTKRYKKDD